MHLIREIGRRRRMGNYISIFPVGNDAGGAVKYGGDGWQTGGHGLNDYQGTGIVICRKHKDIAVGVKLVNRFKPSREYNSIFEAEMVYKFCQ